MQRHKLSLLRVFIVMFCSLLFLRYDAAALDSLSVKKLIEKADQMIDADPAVAHQIFDSLRKLTDNNELKYYHAKALFKESYLTFQEGNYRETISLCTKAATIFQSFNKKIELAKCYMRMGTAWMYLNDYAQSLHFTFRTLKIAEEEKDVTLQSKAYTNIGLVYETLEDWENTLAYAQKALEIKKQLNDTIGLANSYGNIANVYYYQKNDSAALSFFKRSMAYRILAKDSVQIVITMHSIGNLFYEQHQYDSALYYFKIVNAYQEKAKDNQLGDVNSYCLTIVSLGNTYVKTGELQNAKQLLDKCKECETVIEDFNFRKNLYDFKYAYYKAVGNIPAAIKNLELVLSNTDSLYQQSKNFENQRIAIRYEFDQKAIRDSLNYQLNITEQQKTTAEYKSRMYLLAVGILLVASAAGFFYSHSNINRKKQLIAQQETQLAEGKALRAQMNPHFIFNCLNTIDSFVLQNKQQDASQLIQRFSKLSRRILEHTTENFVTVQQELETLNIYLQIEQTRKKHQFNYKINADADVLKYLIPPMLLQPFVENAVLHGISGMTTGQGFISIKAAKDQKYIFFEIDDNGIGREKAMQRKRTQPETHKSLSMDVTLQRLEVLHGHKKHKEYIRFTDYELPRTGTHVEIMIPLKQEDHA